MSLWPMPISRNRIWNRNSGSNKSTDARSILH